MDTCVRTIVASENQREERETRVKMKEGDITSTASNR